MKKMGNEEIVNACPGLTPDFCTERRRQGYQKIKAWLWQHCVVLTSRLATINTCTMMSEVLCEQSISHLYTRFGAVNELLIVRDEVDHSVCCLLVMPHLARLS